jgi:hypothetical protein
MPQGHVGCGINLKEYNTVVYDTEAYTYSTILKLLNTDTVHRLRLGTYSLKTKKLITADQIFDYDDIISKR